MVFAFVACKKDYIDNRFTGTWECIKYSGYPVTQDALSPGNGNLIILSPTGEFKRMKHDTLVFRGTYSISMKSDCYISDLRPCLKIEGTDFDSGNFLAIEQATGWLSITTTTCMQDGGVAYYRKID